MRTDFLAGTFVRADPALLLRSMHVREGASVSVERAVVGRDLFDDLEATYCGLPFDSADGRFIGRSLIVPTRSAWSLFVNVAYPGYLGSTRFGVPESFVFVEGGFDRRPGGWRARLPSFGPPTGEVSDFAAFSTNVGGSLRSLLLHEEGRWSFEQEGGPLPFEQLERYTARRVRDRLRPELIVEYLAALGIRVFDEDFYDLEGARLITEIMPLP